MVVIGDEKHFLYAFAKESRQLECKQSGGNKLAFFDGVYSQPRDSDRVGERLLGNLIVLKPATPEVVSELQ
jgi:hypothetical protein